jgi:hypothetical protein
MTTKELCDALRHTHPSRTMCKDAADVIERLANDLRLANDAFDKSTKEIERLTALAQLAPTCPDQTGGNSNAYYSYVAGTKTRPSY